MQNTVKTKFEEKLAFTQNKVLLALKEKDKKLQERQELTTKLRALRLEKEQRDKEEEGK